MFQKKTNIKLDYGQYYGEEKTLLEASDCQMERIQILLKAFRTSWVCYVDKSECQRLRER